jgi:hypothetical protein
LENYLNAHCFKNWCIPFLLYRDNLSAKFWLEPVALSKSIGFRNKELRKLESLVREHQKIFIEGLYGYFGN